MERSWSTLFRHALLIVAASACAAPVLAADAGIEPARALPPKALIPGVPFVSWRDAAQMRYEHKDILNPSHVAANKMVRAYWDQDRPSFLGFGTQEYQPDHWKNAEVREKGQGLDDLKAWIARGVPVFVQLPLTPHAHPVSMVISVMDQMPKILGSGTALIGKRGPSSGGLGRWASWATQAQVEDQAGQGTNTREMKRVAMRESVFGAWRVVIGYDDERRAIIMHDPSFGPASEWSYEDFEANWRIIDFEYIAAPPKGYAEFVAKRPPSPPYAARTPDMQAAAHLAYGYGLSEIGRTADAERELEKGLALPGISNGYRFMLAFELAHHKAAAGKAEETLALLKVATDAVPQAPGAWNMTAKTYRENPSLPDADARGAAAAAKAKTCCIGESDARALAQAVPRDFYVEGLAKLRGWGFDRFGK